MPFSARAIKALIQVTRIVASMKLHDELDEIVTMTGFEKTLVKQYLDGELEIPTKFKTILYQKSLKLKSDRGKRTIPEYPYFDIPYDHPVREYINQLKEEKLIALLDVQKWMVKAMEVNTRFIEVQTKLLLAEAGQVTKG